MQEQSGRFIVLVQEFDRTHVRGGYAQQEEAESVAREHIQQTGRGAWVLATVVAPDPGAERSAGEPVRARAYWVYEGGWFVKTHGRSWYELNELTYRKLDAPAMFEEVRRTKEYVELYDEDREVAVRLHNEDSAVRLSRHSDAPWEPLYRGRWMPAPLA